MRLRYRQAGLALALVSGLIGSCWAADIIVPEPRCIPAMPSVLSAKKPLVGITTAGSRILAAGQFGHIVYSDDGGKTWLQAKVPVSVDLVALRFQSPKRGWATGHDGILLRTDDGGVSWTVVLEGRQVARTMVDWYTPRAAAGDERVVAALAESKRFLEEAGARPFLDIAFQSERIGYVIGAWGLILRTDDGGLSWQPWMEHVENPRFNHLNAIASADGKLWIVGEQGLLLRYDEASERFVPSNSPAPGSFFGVVGSAKAIVVYGLAGQVFVSADGGVTWHSSKKTGTSSVTGATTLPDGRIVLVDAGAGIWVSADGGVSFQGVRPAHEMSFFAVAAIGLDSLALGGIRGVQVEQLAPLISLNR